MFEADDIRDWLGLSVVDREGSKIGVLEGLYYDTSSDTAAFATVKVGFPGGGRLVFVPLAGARVAPKHLRIEVDKKLAKSAPAIAVDGQLESEAERRSTPTTGWRTSAEPRANGGSVAADRDLPLRRETSGAASKTSPAPERELRRRRLRDIAYSRS